MQINSPEVYKALVDDHISQIQREAEIARRLRAIRELKTGSHLMVF